MKHKKTLPFFLEDFHDQKTIVKGFYAWVDMLDNQQEQLGTKFDGVLHKRRRDMCDWISFQILMVSFIDFLHSQGYSIYRTRGKQPPATDILESCAELKELPLIWYGIEKDMKLGKFPLPNIDFCMKILGRWRNWLHLMPKKVFEFYNANQALKEDKK